MSFSALFKAKFPKCNTYSDYKQIRKLLRDNDVNKFKQEMEDLGIFKDGHITSELKPFNPFARMIANKMENPCKDTISNKKFMIFQNRTENDDHWQDEGEWLGKASMSKHHKFLSPVDDRWSTFNVLTFGMDPSFDLNECIKMLDEMEQTALDYAKQKGWSNNVGLYFHCYPSNSVQTLHLHIIDEETKGPTFEHLNFKNLSIKDVRKVLSDELNNSN